MYNSVLSPASESLVPFVQPKLFADAHAASEEIATCTIPACI